ncbi:MAG TPA: hypothetical protein DHV36_21110 [Desulfobacteraceae bacterium]|nr:hypothetical protein [Desulfobacteraceae bacterium]|tara:strand:- start:15 stop:698 length:684 start_codon:yes stop_codon:yes gene_type:complete
MDDFLNKYITRYDKWLAKKTISFSSKVIPVGESLTAVKQVLPSQQAEKILENTKLIALARCLCRTRYDNCDKPRHVCLILNESGEKWIAQGKAEKISFDRAKEALKTAEQAGLVHMTLHMPDHEVFAFCACCTCCCHDLQLVLKYGKDYILKKADYLATGAPEGCTGCGACTDRCMFGARRLEEGSLQFAPDLCVGCGLCVSACPVGDIKMARSPGVAPGCTDLESV